MKFIVKIFCELATGVNLGVRELNHFRYKKIKPNGITEKEFESWEDLIVYVRSFDYVSRRSSQLPHNHFLNAIMCNPTDSKRYGRSFDHHSSYEDLVIFPSYYCGYLVINEKGRVYDLRNYIKEIYEFDFESHREKQRLERVEELEKKWAEQRAKWEHDGALREGKFYWTYYRHIRTTSERRWASNIEHKPYIRGRRSAASLPHAWDDLYFHREKSWKARNKKARKQYQVNYGSHIDTVGTLSKWDVEYFEQDIENPLRGDEYLGQGCECEICCSCLTCIAE